jgi:hypothetical protein
VSHWLYVTGGTGTAEAILITGGTCTSGAASGTIIATAANSHSGAWSIGSDTGGIEEALVAGGLSIFVPTGTIDTHAEIYVGTAATIRCASKWSSIIRTNTNTQHGFHIAFSGSVSNCAVNTAVTKTAGAAFLVDGGSTSSTISDNIIAAPFNCFDLEAAVVAHIQNNNCGSPVANGLINHYVALPDTGDSDVSNNTFNAGSAGSGAGILYGSGGGMRVIGNKILGFAYSIDLTLDNGAVTSVLMVEGNSFENAITGGLRARRPGTGSFVLITISGNEWNMIPPPINIGAGFAQVKIENNNMFWSLGTGTAITLASTTNTVIDNTIIGGSFAIDCSAATTTLLGNNQVLSSTIPWIGNATTWSSGPTNVFAFSILPAAAGNGSSLYCADCNATCSAGGGTGRTCFRENSAWVH